jgi:hypothetical protein
LEWGVIMFSVIGLVAWAIIGLPAIQYISWPEHPYEWLTAISSGECDAQKGEA